MRKEHEVYARNAEKAQAELQTELLKEQNSHGATKDALADYQQQLQTARDDMTRMSEQMQEERLRNKEAMEAKFVETEKRFKAFEKERQSVEDGLRIEMKGAYEQLNNARDEISSLRQELTMAKAREETLERTVAGLEGRVATQEADLEKRAIKIGELEDQIRRLQGLVR